MEAYSRLQDATYTLMMVDPDAPSRDNPIRADFRHWLVGNIQVAEQCTGSCNHVDERYSTLLDVQGRDLLDGELYGDVITGETVQQQIRLCQSYIDNSTSAPCVGYSGPSPPRGSGYHRYFFYLFLQLNGRIQFEPLSTSRAHFDPDKFALKYSLGKPVAVNFFITTSGEEEAELADYYQNVEEEDFCSCSMYCTQVSIL